MRIFDAMNTKSFLFLKYLPSGLKERKTSEFSFDSQPKVGHVLFESSKRYPRISFVCLNLGSNSHISQIFSHRFSRVKIDYFQKSCKSTEFGQHQFECSKGKTPNVCVGSVDVHDFETQNIIKIHNRLEKAL